MEKVIGGRFKGKLEDELEATHFQRFQTLPSKDCTPGMVQDGKPLRIVVQMLVALVYLSTVEKFVWSIVFGENGGTLA